MRGVRALVAIAVPSMVLMGCAGVGSKTAEAPAKGASAYEGTPEGPLKVMGFSGEDEVAQSRIAAFKQSAPKVQVTNNKGDFDAQQFLTALASGNPPDLVYMDRNLVGTYAAKGAIQPMTDCIAQQKIDVSQYRPAAMTPITLDKVVYGIPEFYIVTTNLVDKRVLAKAGLQLSDIQTADWAKLEATAKKLSEVQGGKIRRLGYDSKMPDSFPLWAMANGAQIVKPDGSPNINDPKAVEALDFNLRLVKEQGGWNSYKAFRDSFDIFGAKNPLTVDQAGAFPMENWYVNVLRDSIGNGLQLGSTMVTDRQGTPISTLGGSAWVIPKGAKNPRAACAWAKTMTAQDTWMKAAEARMATVTKDKSFFTGLFTANKPADEAIKAKYLKAAPDPGFEQAINNYYASLDVAKGLPASRAGAEIDAAWKSGVARALSGQPAQAALDQAQKEAQAAFDKAPARG
jgi:multiple sugar transport system substrate-binding protein